MKPERFNMIDLRIEKECAVCHESRMLYAFLPKDKHLENPTCKFCLSTVKGIRPKRKSSYIKVKELQKNFYHAPIGTRIQCKKHRRDYSSEFNACPWCIREKNLAIGKVLPGRW